MARKKVYTDALNNIIGYDSSRIKNASRTLNLNTSQQTNNAATFDALRNRRIDNSLKQQSNLLSEKELLHKKFYDNMPYIIKPGEEPRFGVQLLKEGGEVKRYKAGGSVKKNKSNMITTRGWGASRKT